MTAREWTDKAIDDCEHVQGPEDADAEHGACAACIESAITAALAEAAARVEARMSPDENSDEKYWWNTALRDAAKAVKGDAARAVEGAP